MTGTKRGSLPLCIPGLLVSGLALLLVRQTLRLPLVSLTEVEWEHGVPGVSLATLLQSLRRLVRLAFLKIEGAETLDDPGVLWIRFKILLGPGYLLFRSRLLLLLLCRSTQK